MYLYEEHAQAGAFVTSQLDQVGSTTTLFTNGLKGLQNNYIIVPGLISIFTIAVPVLAATTPYKSNGSSWIMCER